MHGGHFGNWVRSIHYLLGGEKFEDTKRVIKSRNQRRKDFQCPNEQRTKAQTAIYKTLHRKI